MPLVTLREILPDARREGRAVGAFNVANFESACAVVDAAAAEGVPVILQVYHRLMAVPHIGTLAALLRHLAEKAAVPVVTHLDHGTSPEQVRQAAEAGFSSAMFDGSALPLEENIAQTLRAAQIARRHGISIEAEIGRVLPGGAGETDAAPLTDPAEAERFARETGVDALAVAIGTAHGYYRTAPEIRIDLARAVAERVPLPLVLHGGTGTPHARIAAVVRSGFAKVNIATEFQHAFQRALEEELRHLGARFQPLDKLMAPATAAAGTCARDWLRRLRRPSAGS